MTTNPPSYQELEQQIQALKAENESLKAEQDFSKHLSEFEFSQQILNFITQVKSKNKRYILNKTSGFVVKIHLPIHKRY